MTLKTRRILLAVCIVIFLILSPAIILYTFGFRYDFKEKKIVQTGIVYITPAPQSDIKIFINGREEKKNLSVKGIFKKDYVVYNLLPGTYKIGVQKNGYWEWEKNLAVLPGTITYASPLLLPLNPEADLVLADQNIRNWSFSPNYEKIAYLKSEGGMTEILLYDIERKSAAALKVKEILPKLNLISDTDAQILWSPDSENFALILGRNPSRIVFISSRDLSYREVSLVSGTVDWAEWNILTDSFLYLSSNQKLYSINLKSAANVPALVTDDVSGFAAKNGGIYYLDSKTLFLYRIDPANLAAKQQLSFEPLKVPSNDKPSDKPTANKPEARNGISRLIISPQNNIAVVTLDKNLFLLRQNGLLEYIGGNIESAKFSQNGDSLLYNSPFEIFTYSLADNSENLVTRMGQKITGADWHKDYGHVWFAANNILKNIELDPRPVPNIVDFLTLPAPATNFIFDNDTGNIYYDQRDGDKLTIYRVNQ